MGFLDGWRQEKRPGMKREVNENLQAARLGGLAGWLLGRMRGTCGSRPRLALVERIVLAPRQTLALVEAEGRRFLIATSTEGAPAFYPLDRGRQAAVREGARPAARISW